MKNSLKSRNILCISAAVALLLALGLYIYLYEATHSYVVQAIDTNAAVLSSEATRAQGKDIVKLAESTMAERAKITSLFVPAGKEVVFIKALEAVGTDSGSSVTLSSIHADAPEDTSKNHIGSISANVTAAGTWSEVMRALELSETFQFKSSLNNVTLSFQGVGADKVRRWQLAFVITASTLIPFDIDTPSTPQSSQPK